MARCAEKSCACACHSEPTPTPPPWRPDFTNRRPMPTYVREMYRAEREARQKSAETEEQP